MGLPPSQLPPALIVGLPSLLQAWRLGAAEQRAKVAKLLLAAKRWHQPLLAEAFAEWAEQARRQRALASRLQMALAHWLHNTLLSAFNQWRCQVSLGVRSWCLRMACAKQLRLLHVGLWHLTLCDPPACSSGVAGQGGAQGSGLLPGPHRLQGIPGKLHTEACLFGCLQP